MMRLKRDLIKKFGICLFISIIGYSICYYLMTRSMDAYQNIDTNQDNILYSDGDASNNQWCKIPRLDSNSPSIRRFLHTPKAIECSLEKNWVKFGAKDRLEFDEEAVSKHGKLDCQLYHFWKNGTTRVEYGEGKGLVPGQRLEYDFAEVNCTASDNSSYSNRLLGVARSKAAVERASSSVGRSKDALGLNVFILGFDSMSNAAFQRNLPKAYEYLTKEMESIVLHGYNIVGDGTAGALIPILTGNTEAEMPSTRKNVSNSTFVDIYPWVWKEFEKAGYVTLLSEDDPATWGTFEWRMNGFEEQPTDHYLRPFFNAHPEETRYKPCYGSEKEVNFMLRYGEQFWRAYPNFPKFAIQFNNVYSHNDYNLISIIDGDVVDHLKFIHQQLNDTIVIVMSDHGYRAGHLRQTEQGKLEERLPFFAFAFPQWFRERYPRSIEAFENNTHRLTTPFDIHATLREILDFHAESDLETETVANGRRNMSLFRPIPADRTCADAEIAPHWCTCLHWTIVHDRNDRVIQRVAHDFVVFANHRIDAARHLCSSLRLDHVIKARRYMPNEELLNFRRFKDLHGDDPEFSARLTRSVMDLYQLDVRTQPGNGYYQFTASYDRFGEKTEFELSSITRLDQFGNKPHCIHQSHPNLLIWCICRDDSTT